MLCSMRATSVRLWPLGVGHATSTRSSFPPKPAACMASSITIVHSGRSNRQLRKSGDLCGATGHVHQQLRSSCSGFEPLASMPADGVGLAQVGPSRDELLCEAGLATRTADMQRGLQIGPALDIE